MCKLFLLGLTAALTALSVTTAAAASVTVAFDGTVTRVVDDTPVLDGSVQIGSPLSGSFTYESTGIDLSPDPASGAYDFTAPPAAFRLQVGTYVFETPAGQPRLGVIVRNDAPEDGQDRFGAVARSPILIAGPMDPIARLLLEDITTLGFGLSAPAPGPLSSDQLLVSPPVLSDWSGTRVLIEASSATGPAPILEIEGQVTAIVPEPSSLGLMSGALFLLGARLWRRRAR